MPDINNEIKRRELVIFYVLDTSGSMNDDGKIGVLNEAMRETSHVLENIAKSNADAEIKIAVMQFNSGAEWVTENGPVYLEDFVWDDLKAGGLTDIGMALNELYDKMSREKFLKSEVGQYIPVIIFMGDGYPTDNWEKALEDLKASNKWFKRSTKIAFALGDAADEKVLAKIVGNSEAVVKTNDMELFKRLIRFVSATASMVNSSSRTSNNPINGGDIVSSFSEESGEPLDSFTPSLTAEEEEEISDVQDQVWDDDDDDWD